jgi:hypothetical protein
MKIYHSDPALQLALRQLAITKYKDGELIGSKEDFLENIEAVYISVNKKYDKILEVLFAFCEKNVRYLRKHNLIEQKVNEEVILKAKKRTCRELGLSKPDASEKYQTKYLQNLYKLVYWEFIKSHTLEEIKNKFNKL